MGKIRKYISKNWSGLLITALVLSGLAFLLLFEIGSLTNFKLSPIEVETIASASSLKAIWDNSLYLPLKVMIYVLNIAPIDAVFLRIAPAFIGGITAIYFYVILHKLHTQRVAALAITLFVTAAWFLQISRVVSPVIMSLYSVTALIFLSLWLPHAKHKNWAFLFAGLVAASLVYTPGFLPLLLVLVILKPKKFTSLLRGVSNWIIIVSAIMFLVMLAPLVYSLVLGELSVRTYLGIPILLEPIEWLKRFLIIPAYLFARGPLEPVYNVGRLPVLDIFSTMLGVLGAYAYYYQIKLSRTGLLVILGIFAVVMITLNGALWLPLLMPMVYILMAMGIAVLLQKWFTVFPKNPIARSIGIGLFVLALATIPVYQLTRYFVVWPSSPDTKTIFIQDN